MWRQSRRNTQAWTWVWQSFLPAMYDNVLFTGWARLWGRGNDLIRGRRLLLKCICEYLAPLAQKVGTQLFWARSTVSCYMMSRDSHPFENLTEISLGKS